MLSFAFKTFIFTYIFISCKILGFPDFENTNFLDGKQVVIHNITDESPKCIVDGMYEFTAQHEFSLGTQLFYANHNESQTIPSLIGSSVKRANFRLTKMLKCSTNES